MNRLLPSNFSSRCTFHIEYICQICTLKRYVVRTWAYLVWCSLPGTLYYLKHQAGKLLLMQIWWEIFGLKRVLKVAEGIAKLLLTTSKGQLISEYFFFQRHISALKVSEFRKQIFLLSFKSKTNIFFLSKNGSNRKKWRHFII